MFPFPAILLRHRFRTPQCHVMQLPLCHIFTHVLRIFLYPFGHTLLFGFSSISGYIFCNNSGFIFYAVLLETTQEETTLKENEEKYKKIISVLKNIRIPHPVRLNNKRRNKIKEDNLLKSPAVLSMLLIYDIPPPL